jgi:hypothetical protein
MKKAFVVLSLVAASALTGCVSQTQFLDSKQGMAIETASSKARFELSCQDIMTTVISREVVQPALQGPWVNGIQRAEYTIGINGCGKKIMFVVICPDGGEGCYAAGPGGFHREF